MLAPKFWLLNVSEEDTCSELRHAIMCMRIEKGLQVLLRLHSRSIPEGFA
jgi:hypothetical protein